MSGNPLHPTLPRTLRLKFGQVKHSTNDTVFSLTGQSTASFFIFASIFPLTAPLIASRLALGVGMALGGITISTEYLSSSPNCAGESVDGPFIVNTIKKGIHVTP